MDAVGTMPENQDSLARIQARCKKEPYPKLLGIEVLEIKPGYARVSMQFKPGMQNIFGMLHGGAIFSLLDEAFQGQGTPVGDGPDGDALLLRCVTDLSEAGLGTTA